MLEARHPLVKSFAYAVDGIKVALQKGRNFKIQISFAILAALLGFWLKIASDEWIDLFLIINLVLILELINTSLESIVDLVSPGVHAKAKIAKDVAAAAVLISAFTSLAIGAVIFIPKMIALF